VRVLHVIASLAPRYGGPSKVAPEMCRALANRGHRVELFTTDLDGAARLPVALGTPVTHGGVTTTYWSVDFSRRYVVSFGMAAALRHRVREFDVVHIHSIYFFHTAVAGFHCRRSGVPYVIRPHGTLNPYHREWHRGRKAVYGRLVERRNLTKAAGIHYTSTSEQRHAEAAGVRTQGFVIPLGVDLSVLIGAVDPRQLFRCYPQLLGKTLVTFLGRLTAKKRLDLLFSAFAIVARRVPDVHLVIAGPDDEDIGRRLKQTVQAFGLESNVSLLGLITGDMKVALLQRSRMLVLPSEDENFANSVVEAMGAGIPVVTTAGIAIHAEISAAKAGLIVPLETGALAAAMLKLAQDQELATSMGQCGQALARFRFSWDRAALQLERMYQAITGPCRAVDDPCTALKGTTDA
jgi:glycosyltransferase involved in cell wall biosynthesis